MSTQKNSISVLTIFISVALAMLVPGLCTAGSLEPSDSPGPTMHTLDELYNKPLWHMSDKVFVDWPDNPRFAVYDSGSPWTEDDVVLDKETGLVWRRNPNSNKGDWYFAQTQCNVLNIGSRMGYRLPTMQELMSLIEASGLPAGHPFINVQSDYYWSATTDARSTSSAYVVNGSSGHRGYNGKSYDGYYYWCVRGGSSVEFPESPGTWSQLFPFARFVKALDDDDVVRDIETGLVWQKNLDTTPRNWNDAQYYCNNLNLGRRKGWRLPTVQELASLLDTFQSNPMLPEGHPFVNAQSRYYWSATTYETNPERAWGVNMSGGAISDGAKTDLNTVWCVRGGQGVDPQ